MASNFINSFRIFVLYCVVVFHGAFGSGLSDFVEEVEDAKSSIENQSNLYDGETTTRVPTSLFKSYPVQPNQVYHYAAYQTKPGIYHGVQALLDVYELDAEKIGPDMVTRSQIWIENGHDENLNSIQVGWRVYANMSKHLFIAWTSKGFKDGCDNLNCPGFVLHDDAFVQPMDILSFPIIHLKVSKDMKTGDWWLYANHEPIGHWPKKLVPALGTDGTLIKLGGMVSFKQNTQSPPMGSGRNFSDQSAPKAQMRRIQFVNATGGDQYPSPTEFVVVPDDHLCYQVSPIADSKSHDGYYFNYGGIGGCQS